MKAHLAPRLLAIALLLTLSACGVGQRQNPIASDGELGRTSVQAEDEKPSAYTTKAGDTLYSIAGRPEIYADPSLWPLLQEANKAQVGGKSATQLLKKGLELQVPRGATDEALAKAREQARQLQAAAKARLRARGGSLPPPPATEGVKLSSKPRSASVRHKPAAASSLPPAPKAMATTAPTRAPTAAATAVVQAAVATPTPAAEPAVKAHGSLRPLLWLLLLVLAALGAVLWAFSRRDREGD